MIMCRIRIFCAWRFSITWNLQPKKRSDYEKKNCLPQSYYYPCIDWVRNPLWLRQLSLSASGGEILRHAYV